MNRRREIFESMGIEFRLNTEVGQDISVGELMESFDAIFLGMGTYTNMSGGFTGKSPWSLQSTTVFDFKCEPLPWV